MQRQEWIATELYQRKVLGIRTLEDKALERLCLTMFVENKLEISSEIEEEHAYHGMACQDSSFIKTQLYNYELMFAQRI